MLQCSFGNRVDYRGEELLNLFLRLATNKGSTGAGKMAQWLEACAKDLDSVPITHMVAHNCL